MNMCIYTWDAICHEGVMLQTSKMSQILNTYSDIIMPGSIYSDESHFFPNTW